ncbi:MAG: hypothetical protein IV107_05755 [Paucibacter sp.]|nr:hypothetical protein [Roseateles sp.]
MSTQLDIERCLHALGGNATQNQDASTRAGRLMRELMLGEQAQTSAVDDEATVAMMARLRAAGAFQGRRRQTHGIRWPTWLSLPAAAGLLSLAGVATLFIMQRPIEQLPFDDGLEVMRGAEQAQRLQVADPAAFATELQALLQAQHLLVRRIDAAGSASIQLQAKLPDDAGQLKQDLLARGVHVPAHGRLFLLIERAQAAPQTPNNTNPAQ